MMTVHEFGKENGDVVVLIHPSAVMWDYFEHVIPLLQDRFHLILPALPGYDETSPDEDYTSVEQIATELAGWLDANGCRQIACLYGCSMGGSVVLRMLADEKVDIQNAVVDGGITPYRLPWIVTRLIAVRDFLLVCIGRWGGAGLLKKAFSTGEYSEEDLQYVSKILHFMSYRTIWRTFESCNNYRMPAEPQESEARVQYWCAEAERKDRKWDLRYMERIFPEAELVMLKDVGHGGMAPGRPQEFAARIEGLATGGRAAWTTGLGSGR